MDILTLHFVPQGHGGGYGFAMVICFFYMAFYMYIDIHHRAVGTKWSVRVSMLTLGID